MPELPEVETTARALYPLLLNQPISKISTSGKSLRQPVPNLTSLIGHHATSIHRRAKYILIDFSNKQTLILHLGMSGRIINTPINSHVTPDYIKHIHLTITTPAGTVSLHDPRRFGLALLHHTNTLTSHPLMAVLGPEPLDPKLTAKTLHTVFSTHHTPIKNTIMDSHIIVGIGNIYASESLYRARINPSKPSSTLTIQQTKTLLDAIRKVLTEALTAGGTTLRDYRQPNGTLGHFHNKLLVYNKEGYPCPTCGSSILKTTHSQRSTFWCPVCQNS